MSRSIKLFLRLIVMALIGLVLLAYARELYHKSRLPLEGVYLSVGKTVEAYGEDKNGNADFQHGGIYLMPGYRTLVICGYRLWDKTPVYKIKLPGKGYGWVKYDSRIKLSDKKTEADGGVPEIAPLELDEELMKKL